MNPIHLWVAVKNALPMTVESPRFGTLHWRFRAGFDDPKAREAVEDVLRSGLELPYGVVPDATASKYAAMAALLVADPKARAVVNPPVWAPDNAPRVDEIHELSGK